MFGAKILKDTKYDHFHTNLYHLKPTPYSISMIPSIPDPLSCVRNLPLNKLIKKILRILQTKQFVKLIICINSKGCIVIADA